MFQKRPEASYQWLSWRQIFFPPHPGTRPGIQTVAVVLPLRRRTRGGAVYLGSFRRRFSRHATAHNSKPGPPFPGLCLPACPLQCGQEEHRSRRAPPPWFGGHLLALPSASARLRPPRGAPLRVHPPGGILGVPALCYAPRGLPPLRCWGGGGGPLGRRQTHLNQSLYAVSGPLGT